LRVSKLIALLLGTCMTIASGPLAWAAPSEDQAPIDTEARAMQAYNDGKAAYDAGKYEDALKLFLDAQSLYPSPVFITTSRSAKRRSATSSRR
jgi:outer membrane protein assembly factor BamD (BamD/ComL family)